MRKVALPYSNDSSLAFGHLTERHAFVFLDSGFPNISSGRFDILAADPYLEISRRKGLTECRQNGDVWQSLDDPFEILQRYLGEQISHDDSLPFVGGALGYFSYDLGRNIEDIPTRAEDDLNLPEMKFGLYDWAVIVDHQQQESWLVGQGRDDKTFSQWDELVEVLSVPKGATIHKAFKTESSIRSNLTKQAYATAFQRIKHYIHEGDCYQVNLAQRFEADVAGDSWDAYLRLREMNPAPFAAYLTIEGDSESAILSSSPERFIHVRDDDVEAKPIKGTRPRHEDSQRDIELAEELKNSQKDQAENLMIVDLLRNDMGKNCVVGSVGVPKLFAIESYKTVHHLVSTVTGKLAANKHVLDLIKGAFPGGSITGAPKLRAMEIIEELEPHRRSVYCGSIAYISFDGQCDTNIAIRTMIWKNKKVYFQAGGGIVIDSEMEAEYQETYDKAAAMFNVLTSSKNSEAD